MRNVSREQIVKNFEELVAEDQIQTAVGLLTSAEPVDQRILIDETNPALLGDLLQALSDDERSELLAQLAESTRVGLTRVLRVDAVAPEETDTARAIQKYVEAKFAEERSAAGVTAAPGRALALGGPSPRRKDFTISNGRLSSTPPGAGTITVFSNPSPQEQRTLIEVFEIDEHTLASALDPDEVSRVEFDEASREAFIVWTRPRRGETDVPELLGLASMGFFLEPDYLTIVTGDEAPVLKAGDRADSLQDVVLRSMASTVNEFLVELKAVKRASQEIGEKLVRSLENKQLLRMFDLSEGLVYNINALEANGGVLRRLRALSRRIGFTEGDVEYLDDIIVDSSQCISQAQTFSTILAGLMDARGNLINNNMNVLIKNLTIFNVVFLPLGVLASMGGMSEFSLLLDDYSVDRRVGYLLFIVAMTVIGYALLKGVRFWIDRMFS